MVGSAQNLSASFYLSSSFFPSLENNAVANNAAGDRMISGSPKQSRSQAKTGQWHPMTHQVAVDQNGAFGERTIFLQCSKLLNSICNLLAPTLSLSLSDICLYISLSLSLSVNMACLSCRCQCE